MKGASLFDIITSAEAVARSEGFQNGAEKQPNGV
jgi:hypothetical protein